MTTHTHTYIQTRIRTHTLTQWDCSSVSVHSAAWSRTCNFLASVAKGTPVLLVIGGYVSLADSVNRTLLHSSQTIHRQDLLIFRSYIYQFIANEMADIMPVRHFVQRHLRKTSFSVTGWRRQSAGLALVKYFTKCQ